jgi:hypothetical protein
MNYKYVKKSIKKRERDLAVETKKIFVFVCKLV